MEGSDMNLDAYMNSLIIKNALLDSSMCQIQHEYNREVKACESVERDLIENNKTASRLDAEVTALKLRQKKALDNIEGLKREVATLRSLDHSLSLQLQSIRAENSELTKQQEALLDKYNTKWLQYKEEYEKLPWVQELRKINIDNKKLVIELKMLKQNLFQEEQKNVLLNTINRRREQLPIIALARVSLNLKEARTTNSAYQSKKLILKQEVDGLKEMKKNLIEELAKKTRSNIDVIKHKRDLIQVGHQLIDKTFSSRPDKGIKQNEETLGNSLSFLKLPGLPLSLRSLVGSLHGDEPSSVSTSPSAGYKDESILSNDLNKESISQMLKVLNDCKVNDTSNNNSIVIKSEKRGQFTEEKKDNNLGSIVKNYDIPQNNYENITLSPTEESISQNNEAESNINSKNDESSPRKMVFRKSMQLSYVSCNRKAFDSPSRQISDLHVQLMSDTSNLANAEIVSQDFGQTMEKDSEYWEQSETSSQKWIGGNIESESSEFINTPSEINQGETCMDISQRHTSSPVVEDSNNRNDNKSPHRVDSQHVTQTKDLNRVLREVEVNKTSRNEPFNEESYQNKTIEGSFMKKQDKHYSTEEEDDYRSTRRSSPQLGLESSPLFKDHVDLQKEFVYSERQQPSALKRVKLQTHNEYNRFSQDNYITQKNSPSEPNEFLSSPNKSNNEAERSPNASPPSVFKKPSSVTSSLMKNKATLKQIKKRVAFANWEENNLQPSQDIFPYDSEFSGSQELMEVDNGSCILKRSCHQDRTKNVEKELRQSSVGERRSPYLKQKSLSTQMDFDSPSDHRQTSPPSQQGRQMKQFVHDTDSVMSPIKRSPSPVHETLGHSKSGATLEPEPPSTPDLPQYIMSPIKTPTTNQDIPNDIQMTPMFNFASSSSILSPVRPTSFLNFGSSSEENEPFDLFGTSSVENDNDSNIASNFFKLF